MITLTAAEATRLYLLAKNDHDTWETQSHYGTMNWREHCVRRMRQAGELAAMLDDRLAQLTKENA